MNDYTTTQASSNYLGCPSNPARFNELFGEKLQIVLRCQHMFALSSELFTELVQRNVKIFAMLIMTIIVHSSRKLYVIV